ncbi:MAG: DsbA family protein [Alphaproteobacteria bacterium]|nr:DsbA family protein [Alphaproteobacteria bacterium]
MQLALRLIIALCAACLGAEAHAFDLDAALKDRALGDPQAPITIVEYASFTCPFCAHFHGANLPAFQARYIDSGQVRLIYRDFPPDGLALRTAAIARCLPEARYFDFVAAAFATQDEWSRLPRMQAFEAVLDLAMRHGIDQDLAETCAADEALLDGILALRQEAEQTYGIDSTPSFVLDGKTYAGDMSVAEWAKILDPLLAIR